MNRMAIYKGTLWLIFLLTIQAVLHTLIILSVSLGFGAVRPLLSWPIFTFWSIICIPLSVILALIGVPLLRLWVTDPRYQRQRLLRRLEKTAARLGSKTIKDITTQP